MLGLEKRVDTIRELEGATETESQGPAKSAANMGIGLALVAIVAAVAVYFFVDSKYASKMSAYESRLASMDARVTEAMNAPREMARKVIVSNSLSEISHKVDMLKGQMDAQYQERLAKVDEMLKSIQQDVSK